MNGSWSRGTLAKDIVRDAMEQIPSEDLVQVELRDGSLVPEGTFRTTFAALNKLQSREGIAGLCALDDLAHAQRGDVAVQTRGTQRRLLRELDLINDDASMDETIAIIVRNSLQHPQGGGLEKEVLPCVIDPRKPS